MKLVAISDIHGKLPKHEAFLGAEAILLAGDICPVDDHDLYYQLSWLDTYFRKWLERQLYPVIGVPGNHDFVFEAWPEKVEALKLPWTNIRDKAYDFNGVRFYGTSWVPNLVGWAFYATPGKLANEFAKIPDNTDVLISHGPPFGLCDGIYEDGKDAYPPLDRAQIDHVGSKELRTALLERPEIDWVVCGHIHTGLHTPVKFGDTKIVNVSLLNEEYAVEFKPFFFEV